MKKLKGMKPYDFGCPLRSDGPHRAGGPPSFIENRITIAEPAANREDQEWPERPDLSHLITEDDAPVDNWFQERQQRLLPTSLYDSWSALGRTGPFLAAADVGLFYKLSEQAIVPDVMVSLGVNVPSDWWEKHNRSYLKWEFGKAPEIAIELVSYKVGDEEQKFGRYAHAGVPYYAIYDPRLYLGKRPLRVYALHAGHYVEVLDPSMLDGLGLGLTLWEGAFEGMKAVWLRWCDKDGDILKTGSERVHQETARAEEEKARADRLAARLRELGVDPEL
jgi:Uma2 family endonuclease